MIRTTRARRGTTLVELMVAAAMLILGMWLLVWLYQQGMASFLQAKSAADLTTQERNVATVMTRDLGAQFFLDEDPRYTGGGVRLNGRRLSDQRMDLVNATGGWMPPRGGFFWARSRPFGNSYYDSTSTSYKPNAYTVIDSGPGPGPPTDLDGFTSCRSADHCLQFTMFLPGGSNYQLIGAELQVGVGQRKQFFGTAAEVTYALVFNGLSTAPTATNPTGTPLYNLIRRQRLTAYNLDDQPVYLSAATTGDTAGDTVADVMTTNGTGGSLTMLTALDLTNPANRLAVPVLPQPGASCAIQSPSTRVGEDCLMSNVLSFEIKFTGPSTPLAAGSWPTDPTSTVWPRPFVPFTGNSDYPYDYLPFNGEFDTSMRVANVSSQVATATPTANHALPIKPIRITGVMIRLRAYDVKYQSTRQTTITSPL
jgi:hypothetical protein